MLKKQSTMERTQYFFLIVFSLIIGLLNGKTNPEIYRAFTQGDMNRWKTVMDSLENTNPSSNNEMAELLNYQYGYVAWAIGNNKAAEAKKYLTKAQTLLLKLEKQGFNPSLVYAYKSAFIGFEIGLSPYKAPFIGQKSIEYAKESIKLDPNNSFGYIQMGNIAFYTPTMFGGSKTEALMYYLQAKNLFEKNSLQKKNNWNYLNLLSSIILTYRELNNQHVAMQYCRNVLMHEPNYMYAKNELCRMLSQNHGYE